MVNVIIPTYKARETLPAALDSLVAQTKKMFITSIVQDCDGEDYSDIIEEYRRRGLQIYVFGTPVNGGPGVARQVGLDHNSMCDYVMFMDSDDMLMPRAIDALYREAKGNNADVVISSFMIEQNHQPARLCDSETTPVTWTHGKIYKHKYLIDNKIRFPSDLRLNEDSYFNLVAVNSTKQKFRIPEVTYLWRDNPNSLTRDKQEISFFEKSWEQYILGQARGLVDIERITEGAGPDPGLFAATLNNMYQHFMQAMYHNLDTSTAKEYCKILQASSMFRKAIDTSDFWKVVNEVLRGSMLADDSIIFFKMRFCDWLDEYVLKNV